ncbi:hypothetical protein A2483_02755 [Candidatus Peregrinibacteria bacterium RIFOXYC2_FULL_33_13]|nr:MAG: 50S ribosomal protein L35 [Candidatus Peregrinibacteria bacterium GW2011_GWA2_33_10]KKP40115.1 MAG: hypothetical protein UR30_C0006G0020 [Candidatus Peregrinibacteria bacterium GW2011_GWC2_33_13]OGJ50901.1 MAG: hypothetical protein A2229_02605 [Candidatus Peregrinibacteria bacterium RIFOXYA2_FULL_33_7]OGJ52052.1 MAG: hypothetical protein A2483_02755 [Candidatus Peregrinibacteria bacterium RIFOXYC2_FULL_33_13]
MKLKSHSGLKKRVKKTKNKWMMQKAGKRHLLTNKSKKAKNRNSSGLPINKTSISKVKKLLPYT